jgi:hypothetical protein
MVKCGHEATGGVLADIEGASESEAGDSETGDPKSGALARGIQRSLDMETFANSLGDSLSV